MKQKILRKIKSENIKKEVMFKIKKAKKEILATMDVGEEQKYPLPKAYFSLLKKREEEGIMIKRIVFGPLQQYKLYIKEMKDRNLFFVGKHVKSTNYKRMVMIDGKELFFLDKSSGRKNFYFTTNVKYIIKYKNYFSKFS